MSDVRTGDGLDWQTCVAVKTECGNKCGCGYKYMAFDFGGIGKQFSNPGQGIDKCAAVCDKRRGCTGFEYNFVGDQGYKCGTYAGGSGNIIQGSSQSSKWISCIDENIPTDQWEHNDVFANGNDGYACYRIPSIILTSDNTLLVFIEARKYSCSDHGYIDTIYKRSTDFGATWSEPMMFFGDSKNKKTYNVIGNASPV